MKKNTLEKLKEELLELYHLSAALAVLHWDESVYMPKQGGNLRAKTIASLAGILHNKFVSPGFGKLIREAKDKLEKRKLNEADSCIVREVWREYSREKKLPLAFVKELAEITSKALSVWTEARKKSKFKIFLPYLEKIVELKRKEANFVGFKDNPYDALLDIYEPNLTTEEISIIFEELKRFLVFFLKKIKKSKIKINPNISKYKIPVKRQIDFNAFVAKKIGFDFEAGRMDISAHPFTTAFNSKDVRITTRYREEDLLHSLMSTIHESGHAIYEQGIPIENFGTPLGDPISLGIHESQSRVWENIVGRSMAFWEYFYPQIQKEFPIPFAKIKFKDFYRFLNSVKPSLIRTEADEVTYNLHIIMRFEIEKELLDGSIEAKDLPKIWNSKISEYFGIKVPTDSLGVLQDVHWSGGSIGYFPTYALGNLYAAQFYETAKKDIANLEAKFSKGQFGQFKEWLRENIHIHGKLYSAGELVEKVTGNKLSSDYFINYIKNKYSEIYAIK